MDNPVIESVDHHYNNNPPSTYSIVLQNEPILFTSDINMVEKLYMKQNKYLDKHPKSRDIFGNFLNDSILFI